jgi:hypothetical protein
VEIFPAGQYFREMIEPDRMSLVMIANPRMCRAGPFQDS